jgi:hypothetical protein
MKMAPLRKYQLTALLTLSGCVGSHSPLTREILDEQSGNTLIVVSTPLEFARARTDVAAHARDYATLVAVEIDQAGSYSDFLLLYRWSTVDRRMSPPPDPDQGELHILADGRDIDLEPLADLPISLAKREELYVPPHGDLVAHAYRADGPTLRYIASSRQLIVRLPRERLDTPFALFRDGRKALADFAGQ